MKVTRTHLRRLVNEAVDTLPGFTYSFPVMDELNHISDLLESTLERMMDEVVYDGPRIGRDRGMDEVLEAADALERAIDALAPDNAISPLNPSASGR